MQKCIRSSRLPWNHRLFKFTSNDFLVVENMLDKFAAEISALDRISAMEKQIEFVNSRIRDDALLRNEVPSLNKPDYPFLNADKIGFHRNRIESSSSSQSISGSKKRKAEEFVMEPTQRKLIVYLVTTWKHFAPVKSPHASNCLEYYNFNVLFRFLLAIFFTY